MKASSALARRYARALLDVAGARDPQTAVTLRAELGRFTEIVGGHSGLRAALEDPRVAPETKRRLLAAIAKKARVSKLLDRLLALLVDRDRLALLPALADVYGEELNARRGVVSAEATGAVALTAAQQRALAGALEKATGREIELETRIEPELLGGLRVKMGGRTYDGTVRAHLKALRRSLATGS